MIDVLESKPRLLIGNYESLDNLNKKIVYNNYYCIDQLVPMLRCRGVVIDPCSLGGGKIQITGWQRDITCMRKMDVCLPFIVSVTLNNNVIEEIRIDKTFNGGKGILCSQIYLEKNVQEKFTGHVFDKTFMQKIKLNLIHCFHIYEILNSLYSYYCIMTDQYGNLANCNEIFHDEEAIDAYARDGSLYMAGLQEIKGKDPFEYRFVFHDVFDKVAFNTEGYMQIVLPVKADFYLNGRLFHSDILTQSEDDYLFIKMQKFILKCISHLKELLWPNTRARIMNTNMAPGALIGFLIQCITMRIFKDNYNYIQHSFTALQRPGKIPGCIGSILRLEEAQQYFAGYDMSRLV